MIKKDRFFNAYDREYGEKSIPIIAIKSSTTEPIVKRWLYDRRLNRRNVYRYTRKRLKILSYRS